MGEECFYHCATLNVPQQEVISTIIPPNSLIIAKRGHNITFGNYITEYVRGINLVTSYPGCSCLIVQFILVSVEFQSKYVSSSNG